MAITRPEQFPADKRNNEDQEHAVFEQLKANLPDDAIVVYEPILWDRRNRQHRPDFVVFWPAAKGAVVIEAKNWNLNKIQSADDHTVTWEDGTTRKHPFRAADDYSFKLKEYLETKGRDVREFVHSDGKEKGKPVFPTAGCLLLVGTTEADLSAWAEKLNVPTSVLLSSETAGDAARLQAFLKHLPKAFLARPDARTMRLAADQLCPAGDTEKTLDEIGMSLADLDALSRGPRTGEDDMERYSRHRQLLGLTADKIAGLIASQADGDETTGVKLHPSAGELAQISQDLSEQKFLVGMFGTTAAGKSTLTNALVQDATLLREALGETTRVITRIRPADPEGGRPHHATVLRYKTLDQVKEEILGYLNRLDLKPEDHKAIRESHLGDPKLREIIRTQISDFEKPDLEEKARPAAATKGGASAISPKMRNAISALKDILRGWDECQKWLGQDRNFSPGQFAASDAQVHGENLHIAAYVLERIVYHDNAFTRHGIELVDAPGVGANLQDTNRALGIAQQADAFLMITSVGFKFMQPDQEFLGGLSEVLRGNARQNLLFILNKIQLVEPEPDLETAVNVQKDLLRAKLADHSFEDCEILPVDARCGHYARLVNKSPSDEVAKKFKRSRFPHADTPKENLQLSRLPDVEQTLIEHLVDRKYALVIENNLHRTERAVESYAEFLKTQIESRLRTVADLEAERQHHAHRREVTERNLSEFLTVVVPHQARELFETQLEPQITGLVADLGNLTQREVQRELNDGGGINAAKALLMLVGWINDGHVKTTVRRVIDETVVPEFISRVDIIRRSTEAHYSEKREEWMNTRIPEIIREYGDGIEWALTNEDFGDAAWELFDAVDVCPGYFRQFWINLTKYGNAAFAAALAGAVKTNFAKYRPLIVSEITKRLRGDMDSMVQQTLRRFADLMDKIGYAFEFSIQEKRRHLKDSEAYEKKLKFYRSETEKVLKRLRELRLELESRHPKAKAQASN